LNRAFIALSTLRRRALINQISEIKIMIRKRRGFADPISSRRLISIEYFENGSFKNLGW